MTHDAWGPDREEFRRREMRKRVQKQNLRAAQARLLAVARTIEEKRPPKPDLDVQDGLSDLARELGIRSYRGPTVELSLPRRRGGTISTTIRLPYVLMQHGEDPSRSSG